MLIFALLVVLEPPTYSYDYPKCLETRNCAPGAEAVAEAPAAEDFGDVPYTEAVAQEGADAAAAAGEDAASSTAKPFDPDHWRKEPQSLAIKLREVQDAVNAKRRVTAAITTQYRNCLRRSSIRYAKLTREPAATVFEAAIGNCMAKRRELAASIQDTTPSLYDGDVEAIIARFDAKEKPTAIKLVIDARAAKK